MSANRITRESNNYVSEWYGHEVWPRVDQSKSAIRSQIAETCPFISSALGTDSFCVKVDSRTGNRTGVCTISSTANGPRQNWLACPFRVLDVNFSILAAAVRRLFGVAASDPVVLRPLVALDTPSVRDEITATLNNGTARVFVFSQTAFGGEVDVPETPASPSVKIDSSVVELLSDGSGGFVLGRYMIFEIQTADFHGSPLHAVRNMSTTRNADPSTYHLAVKANPTWVADRVEGPNKANIFKRTIYQTILKIQLARDPDCAGFVIALPEAVWDSWRKHLGLPELVQDGDFFRLTVPGTAGEKRVELVEPDSAWMYVFDIDKSSSTSPKPLKINKVIATTSAALLHYSFERAPEQALERGAMVNYKEAFETRVRKGWQGTLPAQKKRLSKESPLPTDGL